MRWTRTNAGHYFREDGARIALFEYAELPQGGGGWQICKAGQGSWEGCYRTLAEAKKACEGGVISGEH